MSTTGVPLIRYIKDYEKDGIERKKFQITAAGGGRSDMHVAYATGESTEFLIQETFKALEDVRRAFAAAGAPWDGPRRFTELMQVLRDDARDQYDSIVARDYPNAGDKTHANYEELRRRIITAMSDHVYPGEKVRRYLTKDIEYLECKMTDGSGRVEKPVKLLNRMNLIKQIASTFLHHNRGAVFLNDFDMREAFWDIFPGEMQDWLNNAQNIDPFDANNPLDAMEIADHFQRYWNINFKHGGDKQSEDETSAYETSEDEYSEYQDSEGKQSADERSAYEIEENDYSRNEYSDEQSEDERSADESKEYENDDSKEYENSENNHSGKRKNRDEDNQNGGNKRRGGSRDKGRNSGSGNRNGGNINGGMNCAIQGHEKYRHDWRGCFLNPYCRHFNPNAAEEFYMEQAHGPNAFYRDVYKVFQNRLQAEGGNFNNETGQEFQGRGQGHGFQGGRGGGQRGYGNQGYQQGNEFQGDNKQQSYYYGNYNGPYQGYHSGESWGQGQGQWGN